jgi:hypothetical protein
MAHTLANPYLGREPKARVATSHGGFSCKNSIIANIETLNIPKK